MSEAGIELRSPEPLSNTLTIMQISFNVSTFVFSILRHICIFVYMFYFHVCMYVCMYLSIYLIFCTYVTFLCKNVSIYLSISY